jgi:hypothetical protein
VIRPNRELDAIARIGLAFLAGQAVIGMAALADAEEP